MTDPLESRDFQAGLQRLDGLLQEVERVSDPATHARTRGIVEALLTLHGAGLERILNHLANAGEAGKKVLDTCVHDELVNGLLMLHGLHPLSQEERVRQALASVRPYLHSHGGNVELIEVCDGVVRLRLEGSCDGCPSSAMTMKQTIEEAILAKAPDITAVEVDGLAEMASAEQAVNGHSRVALPVL